MKEWNYENEQWTQLPSELKHLPLFTRHLDLFSFCLRLLWALLLKTLFSTYIKLEVKGDFGELYRKYPHLLIISNHSSHLDAVSITTAIPFRYWRDLFIAAAKDYFFSNDIFTFFSQHCLGAIPIDRKDKKSESINLVISLLRGLKRMWLILFPEGTRSPDGTIQEFKRGVSVFAEQTNTPIAFLYLDGPQRLYPKGSKFIKPGKLTIYIGPVHEPAPIEVIDEDYRKWVDELLFRDGREQKQ